MSRSGAAFTACEADCSCRERPRSATRAAPGTCTSTQGRRRQRSAARWRSSRTSGTSGSRWAEDDEGSRWEWEPETYVNVGFRMRADDISDKGIPNMLATVGRVLASRLLTATGRGPRR
ncbi:SitI3 family protein [Micromonospora echinofusca]|uniref:SitI3 family protein n=1 Tax=Micromonospora echinofusca TaxID=47858 RepID=UPI003F4D8ACF